MKISRGLPKEYESAGIELLFEAFAAKFKSMVGTDARGKEALLRCLDQANCFVAIDDNGALLGLLGFQIGKEAFIDPKLKDFRELYSFWQGIKRYFAVLTMYHKTAADELYISDISVSAAARGTGIGTRLIETVERFALDKALKSLTLVVIEPNIGARSLYERMGFVVERRQDIRPVDHWLHWDFEAIFHMRKALHEK